MNIPDINLRSLVAPREAYLTATRDVLSLGHGGCEVDCGAFVPERRIVPS